MIIIDYEGIFQIVVMFLYIFFDCVYVKYSTLFAYFSTFIQTTTNLTKYLNANIILYKIKPTSISITIYLHRHRHITKQNAFHN